MIKSSKSYSVLTESLRLVQEGRMHLTEWIWEMQSEIY